MNLLSKNDEIIVEHFEFSDHDWTVYFLEQYIKTVIASPLYVQETLLETQFQKRDQDEEYQRVQENTTKRLYLPRLGDFATTTRALIDFEQSYFSLWRGHFTQYLYNCLFEIIEPALEESINDFFDVFEDVNIYSSIISNTITGTLLSPLELVRTRYS